MQLGGDDDEGSGTEDSEASSDDLSGAMAKAAGGKGGGQDAIHNILNLQILRQLRKMGKKGSSRSGSSEDSTGHASSRLRGVLKNRKKMEKSPLRFVKRYEEKVRTKLGALSNQKPWKWSDYSWKIVGKFGKMKGLWRCHWMMSECLQAAMAGKHQHVAMMLVQCCKALHQTALDGGSWDNAALLLPWEDPMGGDEWGREADELLAASQYRSAVADLRKIHKKKQGEEEEDTGAKGSGGKGK